MTKGGLLTSGWATVPAGEIIRATEAQKENEILYISTVAGIDNIDIKVFVDYLSKKPYSDAKLGEYLLDIAQLISFHPENVNLLKLFNK